MLAISVVQPAATLMALGQVRWNERTWATGYRGPVLLHAAEALQARAWALWAVPEIRTAFRTRSRVLELPDAPRGVFVAQLDLVDCIPVAQLATSGRYPTRLDGLVNPLKSRNSVLVFENPRVLARPVSYRASAGLFVPNSGALARVAKAWGIEGQAS